VVLIYTDDHGWADLGAQGVDADVRTPNVDRLAQEGVRLSRGYVTAPQCTPSRAGVLTGRHQQRHGVEHNGIPLPLDAVTLPERLKAAGYISGICGKWHLDYTDDRKADGAKNRADPAFLPHQQGFDEYFTGFMHDYTASHALDGTPFANAPRKVSESGFRVVTQTEAALRAEPPAPGPRGRRHSRSTSGGHRLRYCRGGMGSDVVGDPPIDSGSSACPSQTTTPTKQLVQLTSHSVYFVFSRTAIEMPS